MKLKTKNKKWTEKEKYQGKVEKELKDLGSRIDNLIGKANQFKEDSKEDIKEHIESIQSKRKILKDKLLILKTESGQAWHEVKGGIEGAWKELKEGVENAQNKFKEKEGSGTKTKNPK